MSSRWLQRRAPQKGLERARHFAAHQDQRRSMCAFGNLHPLRRQRAASHRRRASSCRTDQPPEDRAAQRSSRLLRATTTKQETECFDASWSRLRGLPGPRWCFRRRALQTDASAIPSNRIRPGRRRRRPTNRRRSEGFVFSPMLYPATRPGAHESLTITCLHQSFAVSVFPFATGSVKTGRRHKQGEPLWPSVKRKRVGSNA
jgi:hypothetical protein